MSDLVELERRNRSRWQPSCHSYMHLTRCLPYFRSALGSYIHRVRSGTVHIWHGKTHHTSFALWCGQIGSIKGPDANHWQRDGTLLAEPPIGAPICATCEGRAIGAGQTESRMICGRVVKFSPRT